MSDDNVTEAEISQAANNLRKAIERHNKAKDAAAAAKASLVELELATGVDRQHLEANSDADAGSLTEICSDYGKSVAKYRMAAAEFAVHATQLEQAAKAENEALDQLVRFWTLRLKGHIT